MLTESKTNNGKDIGDPRRMYEIKNGSQTFTRDISSPPGLQSLMPFLPGV